MKWKLLIGASLSVGGIALVSPAGAQDTNPPSGTSPPGEPAAPAPPTEPVAPKTPSENTETPPTDPPAPTEAPSPPPSEIAPPPPTPPAFVAVTEISPTPPLIDETPREIGDKLAPLIVTAGIGYSYVALKHPDIVNSSVSGSFLEISGGTELTKQLRLSLSFSSFETGIRRLPGDKWEEGDYVPKTAPAGLRGLAGPTGGNTGDQNGGQVMNKSFHMHALGPRLDFYPLGSQGPFMGVNTALGVVTEFATRVGIDVGARVGADWRPFQELSFSIEGGAHGQFFEGGRAAIPYGMARINLLLDPSELSSAAVARRGTNMVPPSQQRTLPTPGR